MQKLVSLLLATLLLLVFSSCGAAPLSTPQASSAALVSSVARAENSTPVGTSSNPDSNYSPRLGYQFFEDATWFMLLAGYIDIENLNLGSESFATSLWHFVYFDYYAFENGQPSAYNLAQYNQNDLPYDRFDIPANTYVQAMKSWYGVDFDISTLDTISAYDLDNSQIISPIVAYNPDEDIVYVTINGIGGVMFVEVDNIDITNEGRLITATITTSAYSYSDDTSTEPESTTYEMAIRENEDQTYTIVSTSFISL